MAGRELVSERKELVWTFRTQLDLILSAVKSCCVMLCCRVVCCSGVLYCVMLSYVVLCNLIGFIEENERNLIR